MNGSTVPPSESAAPGLARRSLWLLLFIGLGMVVLQLQFTVCPFANITGSPCPGCGMTRAALALLRLDVSHAMAHHPLSVICVPLLGLIGLDASVGFLFGKSPAWTRWLLEPLTGKTSHWVWSLLAVCLLVIWVARFFGALGGPAEVYPAPAAPQFFAG